MADRPTDLSSLPSYQAPRRSLFSARKFALMASVVAGLGIAVYGFSPPSGPAGIFSSPAYAQVNNEVRKVAQPRSSPRTTATTMTRRFSRARRWNVSSSASAVPMACRRACAVDRAAVAVR
jgi:hypothetical protein